MRDVDAFEKKYQVGEGTYGSVFVARDRTSNEIVAMKRINTEQEENGFPITALREVKLLKGLSHPNMVILKECVCSKGTYVSSKRQQQQPKRNSLYLVVVMLSYTYSRLELVVFLVLIVMLSVF